MDYETLQKRFNQPGPWRIRSGRAEYYREAEYGRRLYQQFEEMLVNAAKAGMTDDGHTDDGPPPSGSLSDPTDCSIDAKSPYRYSQIREGRRGSSG